MHQHYTTECTVLEKHIMRSQLMDYPKPLNYLLVWPRQMKHNAPFQEQKEQIIRRALNITQ